MTVSPRDRLIITIALAVLVVVALIAFLVYPQFQSVGRLNAEVNDATIAANTAKLKLQERQAFKDRAIETSAKWLRLQNQVPDNPDLPSLIIELQDTAFKSGVQVVTVTPTSPSADDAAVGVSKIPMSIEILGSWADTVDFLESLVRLDRGVRVVNFTSKMTDNSSVVDKRVSPLQAYAVDTAVTLEAYLIPSSSATATPAATQ